MPVLRARRDGVARSEAEPLDVDCTVGYEAHMLSAHFHFAASRRAALSAAVLRWRAFAR